MKLGLAVGAVGFLIVLVTVFTLNAVFGPFERPQQGLLDMITRGGVATLLSIVVAVLLAPVIEEVIFRGVLFQALSAATGLVPAILLSSLAFALIHLEIAALPYRGALFLLGAWFAASLQRSGSLVVPITAHAAFNGITVTLALMGAA